MTTPVTRHSFVSFWKLAIILGPTYSLTVFAAPLAPLPVEGQPLAANVQRLGQALNFLGTPWPDSLQEQLDDASRHRDSEALQKLLDPHVLVQVDLNPEVRVKARRGPAVARLQQNGYTPVLLKIHNQSTTTAELNIRSPQAGPSYSGAALGILARQAQTHLHQKTPSKNPIGRFLELDVFRQSPMTPELSGLEVEYVLALIYSSESGTREATLSFDVGQGTEDLGFRGQVPVLFKIKPAVSVRLSVLDMDGTPTTGRFLFQDEQGHVHPPQARRLEPDLFFQKQIYRADGATVLLPPGKMIMHYGRGPEYRWKRQEVMIPEKPQAELQVKLERWVEPSKHGFYSGDHHIHAAGCSHYTSPSEGVPPEVMFQQVKGEGLNVGCVLTWGPGFDHQKQFFSSAVARVSEPWTLLKYDIEVSGFGSQALGHVCLLNLEEQIYPGAQSSRGWPTWTTPVLRWAKSQGAFTGYAHSGSGLQVHPSRAATRLMKQADQNGNAIVDPTEQSLALLPFSFNQLDQNRDKALSLSELEHGIDLAADQLPNLAIPELNSVGAQEIFVTTAHGLCDFISAMDTARLLEWNCWYHLMNCGFPLKVSGETDFPCMSGTRVGQGRVYVQMGRIDQLDFKEWCEGMAKGRSYVSDGYAHALAFSAEGKQPGQELILKQNGTVSLQATVAFSSETPLEIAHGAAEPRGGRRLLGDTVNLHPWANDQPDKLYRKKLRRVEIVMNGQVVHETLVPADDQPHELSFQVPVNRSSWIALRQFPQLHTNPIKITVAGKPIRASRNSALWSIACIEQLWKTRGHTIAEKERKQARSTFDQAIEIYRRIAAEAEPGS